MASARAMPNPLLHSAGKLMWAPALRFLKADKMEVSFGRFTQLRAADAFHLQPEHHVLQGRKPGQ
jgi:hypothetical protein